MARYYDGYDWDVDGFPGEYVYGEYCYVDDYFMDERWKIDRDFPDYWVSNRGRVWSKLSNWFVEGTPLRSGHVDMSLKYNGRRYHKYLHRMVAEAFIPNPHNYPLVRHLDDDPSNNDVDNLAWGTQYHNMQDCIQAKRFRYFTREDIERANDVRRTPIIAVCILNGRHYRFKSQQEASRQLGICQSDINGVLHHRRRAAKGYKFFFDRGDKL